MESHEHTNEFVIATFSCDLYKMKMLIALGKRKLPVKIDAYVHILVRSIQKEPL